MSSSSSDPPSHRLVSFRSAAAHRLAFCLVIARLAHASLRTLLLATVLVVVVDTVDAADAEFVGVLALAIEDDVADKIGLSESTRAELLDLVDQRESDALDMAMRIRDQPAAERAKQLAPFRQESEQLGLELLTSQQRSALEGIRITSQGMSALADAEVAKRLELSVAQQNQVSELLTERDAATKDIGGLARKRTSANYERQLKAVLNPAQLLAWQGMANPQATASPQAIATAKATKPQQLGFGDRDEIVIDSSGERGLPKSAKGNLRFSFRYAPWATVIEWFASESNLSLLMDAPPQGTFNYSDPQEYTPAQAIDLLNSVLLTKGFTLVRREQMLMVINLEDGIPPNLITEVGVEDLDAYGEYELVKCLFTLRGVRAEDAAEEISRLVGPQGKVNVLASSNQLQITETAGRLRTFRKILAAGEQKGDAALGSAKLIQLRHVRANSVLVAWRKLMGLTEEENVSPDGSTRLAKGKTSRQLLVSGEAYRVKEVEELVALLDVPNGGAGLADTPQLEVYPITEADPDSVLAVMQELFEDAEEIRLAIDPSTGSLVALATPEEHATIRATVTQLQADKRKVEVIRLRTVDPQLAMLSIEKLFGIGEGGDEEGQKPNRNAPRVDADPISRSLLIRASEAHIEDIRNLLVKMGEQESSDDGNGGGLAGGRGNLRMIPIDAATARRALEQMNSIWPSVRKNRIRTVRPSRAIRGTRPGVEISPGTTTAPNTVAPETPTDADDESNAEFDRSELDDIESDSVVTPRGLSKYVVQIEPVDGSADSGTDVDQPDAEISNEALPDVIVTIGDQGLLIASEDIEALDEFEELFMTLADRLFAGTREMAIFYLKHAKSEVASEMLKQFISGGSGSSSDGGGSTLLGTLAGAALGNSGIGSMLGLGGGGASASSARISSGTTIISDPRLNAIIVQATPKELDFIEDLLQLLDKSSSPEQIQTVPRPRAIPVVNADADAVAAIVRSVYATRLAGGASMANRQPSPEEFMRALSGQKDTSKTIGNAIQDQVKVNISVDQRRNALLVVAPDWLFEEIKSLVADLDFPTPELTETVRYGRATGSSPEMIRSAIESIMNEQTPESSNNVEPKSNSSKETPNQPAGPGLQEIKRRMEFFKAIQNRAAKERAAATKKAKAK